MADENDIVEIGVSGSLDKATQSGNLSLKTKSRLIGAVDRLCGNMLDWPATWLKNKADRLAYEEKNRQEAREFLLETQKKIIASQSDKDVARLIAGSNWQNIDSQINLEAVAQEAAQILITESPEPSTEQEKESDTDELNSDWINRFRNHAEQASTEELRNVWARILAGEARRPGRFSAATLRFIGELDQLQAERCERISRLVLGVSIFKAQRFESEVLLTDGLALQAQGLLAGVGSYLSRNFQLNNEGIVDLTFKDWGLRLSGQPHKKVNFECWSVTQIGLEVFSLLKLPDERKNLLEFERTIPRESVEQIELLQLGASTGPNTRAIINRQMLRKKPPAPTA